MSSSSFKELFDVSPKQREIIQWRDARRKELRQKYLKEIHNPMKQTMPVESAVMRLNGLRLQHEYITRDDNEHLYRTGQISYADREFKFS
ncbi:uncharacterized protein LOC725315 isoform X2 [Apis mellifera]|uniref:NADH dehydrogenase [ubiquinone] 1 beta subcomplex subunit 4 n=1 Tax=Apis mellifera TaxID=7460 RepID=A0A7M7ISF8_APIME|nr:uncharacterized protein LOC725315 isoform X2 [Apis mellifera]|eukprot:XP_016772616.1 uncharacterized protein LOC725315 isoform X2 [Apis mellifera]